MSARILVVEDEAIIARDIRATLKDLGYIVPDSVASGDAALKAIRATAPDLVLMDIHIQGEIDGVETALRIRDNHGTPVVYLTSHSDDSTVQRAKGTGAYGYVLKPFTDRDLRTAIEVALQKREIEQRLSERERWFATTLKSIGDAVIATDPEQRITFMNGVAERVTGWSLADAAGKQLTEVLRLIDPTGTKLESPLTRAFREGFAVELPRDIALSMKSGDRRTVDDSAAPIVDDAGKIVGGVVVFRDVTERRQLEDRLAHQERLAAIGTLSAGMAHEINNPLAYVLTNVSFAAELLPELQTQLQALGGPASAVAVRLGEIIEALNEAAEGSKRVHRIVHDLKKFGRLDTAETSTLELTSVLDSAIRMTDNIVRHHARIRRAYGITPFVDGNEGQFGQVFTNLLVNAAQALGEGSVESKEIVVATFTDEAGRAVAEVRDTGPGIPSEIQRRIFDPFFTTKPIGHGSGLGLSIAHAIVASAGGELSVESVVGKGTTFRVALPPARQRVATPAASDVPLCSRRGRILIIDDEPAIGRAMTRALQRDHDVFVVNDARQALSRIATGESFDIIFCDLMMPEMTGMEFFEALREGNGELARRVVFVTGGAFTMRTQEFLDTVGNASMTKPFDVNAVRRMVADYVGTGLRGLEGQR